MGEDALKGEREDGVGLKGKRRERGEGLKNGEGG